MSADPGTVPEIVWEDVQALRPGMDYRDGVVYVTVPAKIHVLKTVGTGKKAHTEPILIDWLACITSAGEQFAFTEENVSALGFAYPEHIVADRTRRWSKESIGSFVKGEAQPPSSVALGSSLRKVYEEFIEFADEAYYDLMPLFVMGTYCFRMYRSVGYIHYNGTAASGKSQNLRILDALAFNTTWASSMSSAALYRSLAGNPGTVCIDEAEGWEGERGEELRRILNAGYTDGSTVKRAEKGKNDNFVVTSFDTYGPKAIASINPLDAVIGSRCLIVQMRPALRRIPEFDKDSPRWQKLRDRLYLWLMYHGPAVDDIIREWNDGLRETRAPELRGRQWQITQMYVTLADYLDREDGGNRCDRLIAFFNSYFTSLQASQDATDRIRLLLRVLPEVIRTKAAFDETWYPLKTIHEVISAYLEEDSKEYYKTRSVGKHLNTLGFTKRKAGKSGQLVQLIPDEVRNEFRQRRVEPIPEDEAWLKGEVEYNAIPAPVTTDRARDDLWANMDEEERD